MVLQRKMGKKNADLAAKMQQPSLCEKSPFVLFFIFFGGGQIMLKAFPGKEAAVPRDLGHKHCPGLGESAQAEGFHRGNIPLPLISR